MGRDSSSPLRPSGTSPASGGGEHNPRFPLRGKCPAGAKGEQLNSETAYSATARSQTFSSISGSAFAATLMPT